MNTVLWSEILRFDLDNPNDEYGFSTRLAFENNWTIHFSKTAILEYKKFMYLAATSFEMVSPSEIVDIVWHQHLIFTNSYSDFCTLLKKRIEHVPSTHNRSEVEKFQKAKERTKEFYEQKFGNQPKEIWEHYNYSSLLNLNRNDLDIKSFKNRYLVFFIVSLFPIYYLLKPILIQIINPVFLIYYILLFAFAIYILMRYITKAFTSFYNNFKSNLIFSNLSPFELIFLKTNKLDFVIHGVVNNLVRNKKIKIISNNRLDLIDEELTDNQYENCVIEILKEFDPLQYHQLNKIVQQKPIFKQLEKSVIRIRKTISDSKEFIAIVRITMLVLGFLLSIGITRFILGITRHKPVVYLFFVMVILVSVANFYLRKILNYLFTDTIPLLVKEEKRTEEYEKDWQWNYFFYGEVVLLGAFIPLTAYSKEYTYSSSDSGGSSCTSSSDSSGSSCTTSCGSSCGSSCGGCGGD